MDFVKGNKYKIFLSYYFSRGGTKAFDVHGAATPAGEPVFEELVV